MRHSAIQGNTEMGWGPRRRVGKCLRRGYEVSSGTEPGGHLSGSPFVWPQAASASAA